MNQIVVRRSAQSASCQTTTVRSHRAGLRRMVNACPTRLRNSATLLRIQIASAMRPKTAITSSTCETRGWSRNQAKSKLGQRRKRVEAGEDTLGDCPDEERHGAGRVDDREHEARADERRVRRSLDGPVRHRQADDVTGTGREDRVDPDARDVGGVDRGPADPLPRGRPPRARCARHDSCTSSSRCDRRSRSRAAAAAPRRGSPRMPRSRRGHVRTGSPYPVAAEGNHDRDAAQDLRATVERICEPRATLLRR